MSFPLPVENSKEIIICDSEDARKAHKELFRLDDNLYITTNGTGGILNAVLSVVDSCNSVSSLCPAKIHIVVNWMNLLRVSLWKNDINTGDMFMLLKNSGIDSQELQPFKNSDLNDIFHSFYYAKRFDILRRLCHLERKQTESQFKSQPVRVICHIISEETKRIVASSL